MKNLNALMVKLVDTKDLKADEFLSEVVQGSLEHSIKSHNFILAFN